MMIRTHNGAASVKHTNDLLSFVPNVQDLRINNADVQSLKSLVDGVGRGFMLEKVNRLTITDSTLNAEVLQSMYKMLPKLQEIGRAHV